MTVVELLEIITRVVNFYFLFKLLRECHCCVTFNTPFGICNHAVKASAHSFRRFTLQPFWKLSFSLSMHLNTSDECYAYLNATSSHARNTEQGGTRMNIVKTVIKYLHWSICNTIQMLYHGKAVTCRCMYITSTMWVSNILRYFSFACSEHNTLSTNRQHGTASSL